MKTMGRLVIASVFCTNLNYGSWAIEFDQDESSQGGPVTTSGPPQRRIVVNRVQLSDTEIARLEKAYRTKLIDGSFWYDSRTGAWGLEGGPTLGFVLPGIRMGGPLRADASNGNTGVFINGRQLHVLDVRGLTALLGLVLPGRYWVDAQGNCGYEGGPALLNLLTLARSRGGAHYGSTGMLGFDGNGKGMFFGKDAVGNHIQNP